MKDFCKSVLLILELVTGANIILLKLSRYLILKDKKIIIINRLFETTLKILSPR